MLDNEVELTDKAWAADVRRTRHIGDLRKWPVASEYRTSFQRLTRDLRGSGIKGLVEHEDQSPFDDDIPF